MVRTLQIGAIAMLALVVVVVVGVQEGKQPSSDRRGYATQRRHAAPSHQRTRPGAPGHHERS